MMPVRRLTYGLVFTSLLGGTRRLRWREKARHGCRSALRYGREHARLPRSKGGRACVRITFPVG
jgi:hypothetical protein